MYKKRNLYCITKNAIKVSPFSCDTGCFHRTDDTTNAHFKSVGYSPLFGTIIYHCQKVPKPCKSNILQKSSYIIIFL